MKTLKEIYESVKITKPIKVTVSSDNFTNILAEDDVNDGTNAYTFKINIEDDFMDDSILALYKVGASKYNLKFEIENDSKILFQKFFNIRE